MSIDWWTLGLQVVNFLVLVWILQHFLYRPVRDVMDRRRQEVDQKLQEAEQKGAQADEELSQLDQQRRRLDQRRSEQLAEARQEAEARREELIEEAKQEAESIRRSARRQIERERRRAVETMEVEAAERAVQLAERLVKAVEVGGHQEGFWQGVVGRMESLDPSRREAVRRAARPEADVEVRTATPVDDDRREAWSGQLRDFVQAPVDVSFVEDNELLAGVEVTLPGGAVVRNSWRAMLERARDELRESEITPEEGSDLEAEQTAQRAD